MFAETLLPEKQGNSVLHTLLKLYIYNKFNNKRVIVCLRGYSDKAVCEVIIYFFWRLRPQKRANACLVM